MIPTRTANLGRALLVALAILATPAQAQLFRAYLSIDGNDANACTLPAPCRLLPAALAAVANGGEVWMLDSANYNTAQVAVTKSVTILAVPGAIGSVLATAGNGSAIAVATPGLRVTLRNVVITALPGIGFAKGVSVVADSRVALEGSLVYGFGGPGIECAGGQVRLVDSIVRDNLYGLFLQDGARANLLKTVVTGNTANGLALTSFTPSTTTVDIADSSIDANGAAGVQLTSSAADRVFAATIRGSRITRNVGGGLAAQSNAGAAVTLNSSDNQITGNGTGISIIGAGSRGWVERNTITLNTLGLYNDGLLESAGNNAVRNNGTESTGTITLVSPLL